MAYTKSQQDRIDAATLKVTNAKTNYDNSLEELSKRDTIAHNSFDSVMLCSGFKGETKSFSTLNPAGCAFCVSNCSNCGGPGGDQVSTCKSRVATFNIDYNNLNSYQSEVDGYLRVWNSAKTELDGVIASVIQESGGDPTNIAELERIKAEALAEASARKYRYIFYSIAVIVIGVGIYLIMKLRKKKAA